MTLLRTLKYNIVTSFVHYFFDNAIGMILLRTLKYFHV
jgi:hypothetical protein